MSIESEQERQERIRRVGIGSPEYFGEVFRLGTSNQIRDEWGITDPIRVRGLVAAKLGIFPEEVEALEQGELGIPTREQLVEWNRRLNLAEDINDDILLSAGYIPDVPDLSSLSLTQRQVLLQRAIAEVVKRDRRMNLGDFYTIGKSVIGSFLDDLFRRK